ncbi:hybrid sensor histidine kinase/response regulator [Desulfovibrio sp. JC010]|uniref:hybrid sensor histidine kinase/response regulator n=1 Tax=Desulfovibrio sp. JC010 TaxID=2593641 RepID=UPI0013D8B40B|nr:hybrid sensor histidine kinase/response regulator [Desulfovibrio sp. JC010]NDV28210.1 hybrid sensor histidine kinase/response regulator [Desulfovibrio sp. JC010]
MHSDNLFADDELLFSGEEAEESRSRQAEPWRVLIVDDEPDVHSMTRMVLGDFEFEARPLDFTSAHSGEESIEILKGNPDYAVVLLDVVMETNTAGLDVARRIRNELNNQFIRIILRTGQPGFAPEHTVITELDINDYWQKAELTSRRLTTSMTTALRSYRDLHKIELNRESLAQMAKSVAHQIRNRTMTINGFAGLASRKLGPDSEVSEYLETIAHETARLEEIVKSVSSFASIDHCDHCSSEISDVAEKSIELCREYAKELGRDVFFDIALTEQTIDARPDLLTKVIVELLSNAVFFADEQQPRVKISARVDGDFCMLVVADNGDCVAESDLPYIFDPFYTTRPEAVGMGLSIVNRITSGYNWSVDVSCSDEGGAVFSVAIPL